jgi:hypothetical protein
MTMSFGHVSMSELRLKSDPESKFVFSELLEGMMPIAISLTFLTKSSLCSHLSSTY